MLASWLSGERILCEERDFVLPQIPSILYLTKYNTP